MDEPIVYLNMEQLIESLTEWADKISEDETRRSTLEEVIEFIENFGK